MGTAEDLVGMGDIPGCPEGDYIVAQTYKLMVVTNELTLVEIGRAWPTRKQTRAWPASANCQLKARGGSQTASACCEMTTWLLI